MKRLKTDQIKMYHPDGWNITIPASLSRIIRDKGLVHAEVNILNEKLFLSFTKTIYEQQKNIVIGDKKNTCNAYIKRQDLLNPIVKHFNLQSKYTYYLSISENKAKVPDILTFQLMNWKVMDNISKDNMDKIKKDTQNNNNNNEMDFMTALRIVKEHGCKVYGWKEL